MYPNQEQLSQFCDIWRRMEVLYEDYAKSIGLSYTSLNILYYIYKSGQQGCTQKTLCEKTLLPKQTVHSVIRVFLKQGRIELVEDQEDRRRKCIRLTPQGISFYRDSFERLEAAENTAMGSLSPEDAELMIRLLRGYTRSFEASIK